MIGIIIITVTYFLLRLEKRNLVVLGFNKPLQRIFEFVFGLLIAGFVAATQYLLIAHFSSFNWVINSDLTWSLAFDSIRWNINSVLFEELLFRGYLLYKAIEWLGARKGCFLSAIAFGVYHWFSYGVLGNLVQMVYVFLMTGMFGLMLAYAFERTKSIALPIALHFGWNLVTIFVFSNGPIGRQLLVPSIENPEVISGYEQVIVNIMIPIIYFLAVIWLLVYGLKSYRNNGKGIESFDNSKQGITQ